MSGGASFLDVGVMTVSQEQLPALIRYDAACRALAEAVSVDEIMLIHDQARALAACARIAKNRDLEADAVVLRMRAVRRLDRLRQAQKETIGLAKGGEQYHGTGVSETPVLPTLASQGIDKNLAKQARALGALSDEKFETVVADVHDKISRAVRNAVREVEIQQERESYAARVEEGCTIADLEALAATAYRASVIYCDAPSEYETYSGKGKQRSAEKYYDTESSAELKAKAPLIQKLAAKDCVLLYWTSGPHNAAALDVIAAWGFEYKTGAFVWIKTKSSAGTVELEELRPADLHLGAGLSGSRANAEIVLLATRGRPKRLTADIHQVVIAPVGGHSAKPEEVRHRIERLFPGPYLELYGRKPALGWIVWGNEIPRAQFQEAAE
jgi:N6-adenosine-specific RNA methylase IME4